MPTPEWLAEQFEEHRAHLRAVAYRMLGSASEAEDAVQESWIRLDSFLDSESDRRFEPPGRLSLGRSPQARTSSSCTARADAGPSASASSTATYTRRCGEITHLRTSSHRRSSAGTMSVNCFTAATACDVGRASAA